jgi:hypothetical protein
LWLAARGEALPANRSTPTPPGDYVEPELLNMEAGALVRRARTVDEYVTRMDVNSRRELARQMRALAHDLSVAAGKLEVERPDPDWIPEFIRSK